MNPRVRLILFLLGAAGLASMYLLSIAHLPAPDELRNRYLNAIDARSVSQRNTSDAVSAVNFDFRGFDTLGEEFILFVSVIGAVVLLREAEVREGKQLPDAIEPQRDIPPSDSVRVWIVALVAPKVAWGIYVVTHGQLTPGGGFQGGVILATVPLIIYLGEDFKKFKRIVPHWLIDVAEASGAGAYVLVGFLALLWSRPFLTNVLPLGKWGEPTSAGTMALISLFTGLEVAAGFTLLLFAFLQETLIEQKGEA
jgi:multicomponent Na+:H+ antiporter subunit B